ncbi:tautomerase family protein [Nocardiopsis sp. MG754419]|uniref:tautomerase family protein n=1 Tax=Nocardiopsis sp. MG754419 TaxID=2259865 RepID=UPI001BA62DA2|nr:tautomerase family protein [Nocardiopsis sp. MG754419]MBR8740776.1 4-oxalocrotonate tautomerase [Nocardiopsis sp. MG754419]
MPVIDITLGPGRSPARLRALVREVTEATHRSIGAPVDGIRVFVREVPDTHWSVAGVLASERDAPPDDDGDAAGP